MAFLNGLISKIKNIGQSGNSAIANGVQQAMQQNSINSINSPVAQGANNFINNTPDNGAIQSAIAENINNSPTNAENTGANKINKVLGSLNPSNWDDTTRQRVLMASQFLSGFGGTQYDPNSDLMGNIARGISNGSNAAYKQIQNYGNYQQVKNLYDQMGYDSSGLSPLGDYSGFTPAAMLSAGARMKQNQIKQDIANTKDKTTRIKMIMDALNKGYMTPEEAKIQLQALDFVTDLTESNDTKKTKSQVNLDNKKAENVGKPKVNISIRKGGTTSTVKHEHTSGGGNTKKPKLLY